MRWTRPGLLAAARAGPAARAPGRADGVCAVPASALGRQRGHRRHGRRTAVRGAVRAAAQRDPLDRHPRFDGRLSGAGRRRGGGGIPRDVRIVPAARAAAGRRGMALGFTRSSSAIRWRIRSRRALHAQSAAAFPPNRYFGDVDGPFRSFAHVSIIHGLPDDDGAFKSVLERMCHWDTVATPQALAAWPITTAAGVSRGTRRARSCWTAPRCWRRTRRTTISTSWRRPPCCGMAATMSKAIS